MSVLPRTHAHLATSLGAINKRKVQRLFVTVDEHARALATSQLDNVVNRIVSREQERAVIS